ncbi:hypothetical protein FN846DRAFT_81885 [Sphaerosporella brunnea]|uniref:Uncharacterized protein n=1 Tax=Sphaerosporella brunnea TaxID=1250544 RepID=A0A5J5F8Q4_9PEZI|nr:hypothetical protein FN846DRAFT_81885 [Sphaerosporella brunnea]
MQHSNQRTRIQDDCSARRMAQTIHTLDFWLLFWSLVCVLCTRLRPTGQDCLDEAIRGVNYCPCSRRFLPSSSQQGFLISPSAFPLVARPRVRRLHGEQASHSGREGASQSVISTSKNTAGTNNQPVESNVQPHAVPDGRLKRARQTLHAHAAARAWSALRSVA